MKESAYRVEKNTGGAAEGSLEIRRLNRLQLTAHQGVFKYSIGAPRIEDSTRQEKIILVVGGTGSGKTTLINCMTNYLYDVQRDDPFRLKLITERDELEEAGGSVLEPGKGRTKLVKQYALNGTRRPYRVLLIDTPGFGDPDGLDADKKTAHYVKLLFGGGNGEGGTSARITAICFVIKASETRLTAQVRTELTSVLALFGKDMEQHISLFFTFSDGLSDPPTAVDALRAQRIPYSQYFLFNNGAMFDTELLVAKKTPVFVQKELFWNMSMIGFQRFFDEAVDALNTRSLKMSVDVLQRREQLELNAMKLSEERKLAVRRVTEMRDLIEKLRDQQANEQRNEQFAVERTITVPERRSIAGQGVFTTTCIGCNYTCHKNCKIADNDHKEWCSIMRVVQPPTEEQYKLLTKNKRLTTLFDYKDTEDPWFFEPTPSQMEAQKRDADCLVCPGHCSWRQHVNTEYVVEYVQKTETVASEQMFSEYRVARSEQQKDRRLIENVAVEFVEKEHDVAAVVKTIRKVLNNLHKLALLPQYTTDVNYLEMQIRSEEMEAEPGYEKRIAVLQRHLETAKVIEKAGKSEEGGGEQLVETAARHYLCRQFPLLFKPPTTAAVGKARSERVKSWFRWN